VTEEWGTGVLPRRGGEQISNCPWLGNVALLQKGKVWVWSVSVPGLLLRCRDPRSSLASCGGVCSSAEGSRRAETCGKAKELLYGKAEETTMGVKCSVSQCINE